MIISDPLIYTYVILEKITFYGQKGCGQGHVTFFFNFGTP